MNIKLNEKERVCHEVHHHSIETILFCRKESYTVLFKEGGWKEEWHFLALRLRCTANMEGQYVVLFGHFSQEQVDQVLGQNHGVTVRQVTGRHHMEMPFLPCNQ